MTTKSGCTKCGGIILADTEDWENPLCHAHWVDIGEPQNEPRCINPNLKSEFKICGDALEFVPRAKYQDLIAKHERVLQALEIAKRALVAITKRHDWMPEMGQCICKEHKGAYEAIAQIEGLK